MSKESYPKTFILGHPLYQQLAASNVSLFSVLNSYKNGKVHTGEAFYLIILERVPSQPFLLRQLGLQYEGDFDSGIEKWDL